MKRPTDIVYTSIREMPLMLAAKQAAWVLGIARATFYRRIADGTIEAGIKLGPNTRRWRKEYIFSLRQLPDRGDDWLEGGAPAHPPSPGNRPNGHAAAKPPKALDVS